jgi:hypothetical protein
MEVNKVPTSTECVLLLFVVGFLGYHCAKKVKSIIANEAARESKASNRTDDT